MRVEGRARPAVRTLRAMLDERDSPIAGAKLIVNTDVLIILYLTEDAFLGPDLLRDVAECCGAAPFRPYDSTCAEPHLAWMGASEESGSLRKPVY